MHALTVVKQLAFACLHVYGKEVVLQRMFFGTGNDHASCFRAKAQDRCYDIITWGDVAKVVAVNIKQNQVTVTSVFCLV